MRKLKLSGSVLVVLAQDELDAERSFANLPQVQTTTFGELSAHDVLRADWLVFSDRTLPAAASDFSGTHVAEEAPEPPSRRPRSRASEQAGRRPPSAAKATEDTEATNGRRRGRRRGGTGQAQGEGHPQGEGRRRAEDQAEPATEDRRGGRRPMRDAMSVLIRPVVSEKSYALMDQSVYVFIVDPRATKIEVRHAVEQAFSVRVTKVNTLNRKGKATRNRRTNVKGKRPDTKRAIVTLHPDDSIDLFDR